ncbi:ATP-binding protein [Saccharibacillus qingshengii]|uniref:ATP-binding protein n=1 Tax=Saccharibacillus qingshengii TaxID=1763540 RepID=UPI0015520A62|nr:ATP-binding protein [Saccharibacillus qingshengii]
MEAEGRREIERLQAIVEGLNDRIVRGQLKEERILNDFSEMNNELVTLQRQLAKSNWELQEAVREAEKANEAKDRFLAMISHEFRTPMNAILGITELLRGSALGSTQQAWTELIDESATELLGMVNDLLDLSKSEAGALTIEAKPFDPRTVVAHVAELLKPKVDAKRNRLDYRIDPSIASTLHGDPTRLRQILINLVHNANAFTEEGDIRIDIRPGTKDAESIRFEIQDSGIGISEANLSKLFKPYSQTEAGKTKAGTGLGLMICKSLVDTMKGEIGVFSRENAGSTFWFEVKLPPVETPEASAASLHAVPSLGMPASDIPILVVEDNPINSRVIGMQLKKLGLVSVQIVSSGQAAVEAFLDRSYALILMDKRMPVMGGIEATRRIRELEHEASRRPVPIIALTGDSIDSEREACLEAGMNDFLGKPVNLEALGAMLQKWIPKEAEPILDLVVVQELVGLDEGEEPEVLRALLEVYEQETPGKLERLEEWVLAGAFEQGIRVAHNLKSGSLSLGVNHFSRMLERIEHALRQDCIQEARDVLPKLQGAYQAACAELRRFA